MSNSSLVQYTKLSPNCNKPRNQKIDKITIHHCAGVLSAETIGNIFAPSSRQASSNYGVGYDGKIGMYVEEQNRSWCSSSPSNDHRAITIEVSNSSNGGQWPVSDYVLERTIQLCVDICKRNGIAKLNYTGDANGNLTRHNMFASTSCPGPYLQSKFPYIAEEVNKRLGGTPTPTPTPTPGAFKEGDKVALKNGAPLYKSSDATKANGTSDGRTTTITRTNGSKHKYNTTGDYGWMDEADITKYVEPTPQPTPQPEGFKAGDIVIPTKLVSYDGVPLKQWDPNYIITEVKGDRAVLAANRGGTLYTWAAMNTANIKKV